VRALRHGGRGAVAHARRPVERAPARRAAPAGGGFKWWYGLLAGLAAAVVLAGAAVGALACRRRRRRRRLLAQKSADAELARSVRGAQPWSFSSGSQAGCSAAD